MYGNTVYILYKMFQAKWGVFASSMYPVGQLCNRTVVIQLDGLRIGQPHTHYLLHWNACTLYSRTLACRMDDFSAYTLNARARRTEPLRNGPHGRTTNRHGTHLTLSGSSRAWNFLYSTSLTLVIPCRAPSSRCGYRNRSMRRMERG